MEVERQIEEILREKGVGIDNEEFFRRVVGRFLEYSRLAVIESRRAALEDELKRIGRVRRCKHFRVSTPFRVNQGEPPRCAVGLTNCLVCDSYDPVPRWRTLMRNILTGIATLEISLKWKEYSNWL